MDKLLFSLYINDIPVGIDSQIRLLLMTVFVTVKLEQYIETSERH